MKEPIIKTKDYDFWVNGKKYEYRNYEKDKQDLMICKCGNKIFWIFQPAGRYETNAICTKCNKSYCVQDD